MKASELVKHLKKLVNKHGDLEVMIYDNEFGGHYGVAEPKCTNSKENFSFSDKKEKFVSEKIFEL